MLKRLETLTKDQHISFDNTSLNFYSIPKMITEQKKNAKSKIQLKLKKKEVKPKT